jgi:exosortase
LSASVRSRWNWRSPALGLPVLGILFLWCYWPTFASMVRVWSGDPQYSHGYLVPAFALVLLWLRRRRLAGVAAGGSWWGVGLVGAGAMLRLASAFFFFEWFEQLSLLPTVAGLFVVGGGWPALRWAWPAVGFLFFMIPLPYQLEFALAAPLQRAATLASTYALQTLGFACLSEGNVILMGELKIGVIEACSGLSMLLVFFALSFAVALVIQRPFWQKAVVVASAVPIALVSNVTRITVTGVLYQTAGSGVADAFFHDLAGWLMMPLALGLLWVELRFLAHLFVAVPPVGPLQLSLPAAPAQPVAAAPFPVRTTAPPVPRPVGEPTLP